MATNTLEFTLKDGSTQILDLSVLANILYIDLVMADGTVLKVPSLFNFQIQRALNKCRRIPRPTSFKH